MHALQGISLIRTFCNERETSFDRWAEIGPRHSLGLSQLLVLLGCDRFSCPGQWSYLTLLEVALQAWPGCRAIFTGWANEASLGFLLVFRTRAYHKLRVASTQLLWDLWWVLSLVRIEQFVKEFWNDLYFFLKASLVRFHWFCVFGFTDLKAQIES